MQRLTSTNLVKMGILFSIIFFSHCAYAKQIQREKTVFGKKERVLIFKEKVEFKAKLDTGAKISSLSATNIHEYKVGEKSWISFLVEDPTSKTLIRKQFPLKRYVYIKQHYKTQNVAEFAQRPTIEVPMCFGSQYKLIEINLTDRSNFLYPVLLGRNALLAFGAIVDPGKKYTSEPNCNGLELL